MIKFDSGGFNATKEALDNNIKEITKLLTDASNSISRILNKENINSESWQVFNSKYTILTKDIENITNKLENIKAYLESVAGSTESIETNLDKAFSGLNG